jgi:two-component system, OmpR family, response regulator
VRAPRPDPEPRRGHIEPIPRFQRLGPRSFRYTQVSLIWRLGLSGDERMRVLVVEDEIKMAELLRRGLREEGYAVDVAGGGAEALWLATENPYDVILLDLMLRDADGIEVCRSLREKEIWSPVIMVTARDAIEDHVRGLDVGADDYLTKPFSFAELLARIRALLRRSSAERPAVLSLGDLRLDPATRQVWRGDSPIEMTPKEFALLEYFMRNPEQVLSRTRIIQHVWDFAYEGDSNVVDVYVRYLREKIDRPFGKNSLQTVRGAGYRLREESDARAD